MVAGARRLADEGVAAITTGCGFNALFQRQLADCVSIPVFTSSLLQVPMVHHMLRTNQSIGIITADSTHLSQAHLEAVGITRDITTSINIYGIQESGEFSRVRSDPAAVLDAGRMRAEIVDVALRLLTAHPETGAIVLECTDLPPFSVAIRRATRLPVFDIVTMVHWVMDAVSGGHFT
jgi:Asp/Glu/hydantoin racemase